MNDVTKDLLEALKAAKDYIWGITAWTKEQEDALSDAMSSAIARAEAALAARTAGNVGNPAPPNSLPSWKECQLIIENHEFRTRAKAGLEGSVIDTSPTTPEPTALHRFIYEYDDSDPHGSAWFLHRLETLVQYLASEHPHTAPQPDADGWIPWAGGECPVGPDAWVEAKLRDGKAWIGKEAQRGEEWLWDHDGGSDDIIAYRVVEAQP